jgi:histidinol phosphatase-like PHP family hydrolase
MNDIKIIDLHSHTFHSDGIATPTELIRYAQVAGYSVFAITDHVDLTNYKQVIDSILTLKNVNFYPLIFIPGIEITHVLPDDISKIVNYARKMGIKWIGVHGETPTEPVIEGTNYAAIESRVDFLAHPGFITGTELKLAVKNNVWIELTARNGHSLTNGYIYQKGKNLGVNFIISSDSHKTSELFSKERYIATALGSGMSEGEFLEHNENLYNHIINNLL